MGESRNLMLRVVGYPENERITKYLESKNIKILIEEYGEVYCTNMTCPRRIPISLNGQDSKSVRAYCWDCDFVYQFQFSTKGDNSKICSR